jgi:nitronate monooxygenase
VPQIADAVAAPIIAAGGIADGRGIAAACALGAAGVQIGTAYLFPRPASVGAMCSMPVTMVSSPVAHAAA